MRSLISLLALLSCIVFNVAAGAEPPPAAAGEMHGGASERLQAIMQHIKVTTHDTGNVDTAGARPGNEGMADMIEAVEEQLFHAELMTSEPPRQGLTQNQQTVFRALASQLYTETLDVQQVAQNYNVSTYDFNLLEAAYERLYQTCAACHELFRDRPR